MSPRRSPRRSSRVCLLSALALVTMASHAPSADASPRRGRRGVVLPSTASLSTIKSDESVVAALAATPAGGVCRLPFGSFRTAVVVDRPMTLVADPRGTRLDAKGLGRPAIEVVAGVAGVTLDGVHVTASDVEGIRVGEACDGLRLMRVTVERCTGPGVVVARSASVRLEHLVIDRNGGDGLDLHAVGGRVVGGRWRQNPGAAVRLRGSDVEFTGALIEGGAEGVVFDGRDLLAARLSFRGTRLLARFTTQADTCTLARCEGRDVGSLAVADDGAVYARIEANRVAGTAGDAVVLRGTWHAVEDNRLGKVAGTAVVGEGLSLRVADNVVERAGGGGIHLAGMGNTIEGNLLGPCGGDAIVADGTASLVARNRVEGGAGTGLVVTGDHALVASNQVRSVPGAGVRLAGDDGTLQDNRLEDTGLEGIVVSGDNNRLVGNSVARCGGRGVYVEGTGTVFERNRIDGRLEASAAPTD